ncbi:MAG: methyltransferase domain-containing protein [Promethearchaeota archaeon]
MFDVELINQNILQSQKFQEKYDLLTFWGAIEHYNYPIMLLRSATSLLNENDMIIVKVPRWNCLSTAIQQIFSDSIIRHLDPLGHLHVFTDSSIATAFEKCNLNIVGAWYFGMDCYELILQLSNFFNAKELVKQDITHEKLVPYLQEKADIVKFSDGIVLSRKLSR